MRRIFLNRARLTLQRLPIRYWIDCRCPATHLARAPWFTARGLHLRVTRYANAEVIETPVYGRAQGYPALRDCFGLTWQETLFIFDPSEYYGPITDLHPSRIIDHIDSVIETYEDTPCSKSKTTG